VLGMMEFEVAEICEGGRNRMEMGWAV